MIDANHTSVVWLVMRKITPVLDRIFAKVKFDNGCWTFGGTITKFGHGRINLGRATDGTEHVHRVVYRELVGPIPDGLVIDHLCRNPACVNPTHLEAVTWAENIARGVDARANRRAMTKCKRGHEFTPQNTKLLDGGTRRDCIACRRSRRSEKRSETDASAT